MSKTLFKDNTTDREHLMSHLIVELLGTIQFLEGCIYNPDRYDDRYPEMRERNKEFYISVAGRDQPFCQHMLRSDRFWTENPDCPGCQWASSWEKYVRPVWDEWCKNNGVKD